MRLYNRMNPWALRGADRVVTVCKPFLEQLVNTGVPRSNISVVPNAIDASTITSGMIPKKPGSIVSIGRLSAEKGHRYLIEALAYMNRKHIGVKANLVLIGDGPERASLEQQVSALGLRDQVLFTGHQADTAPFYSGAELFVLPSLSEGSPLVLLEAALARAAIVATSVGGVPETVSHEHSALLVPPRQPEALGDAMARLLTNRDLALRLTSNAYRDVTSPPHTGSLLRLFAGYLSRVSRPPLILSTADTRRG